MARMWGSVLLICGCVTLSSGLSIEEPGDMNGIEDEERQAIVVEGLSLGSRHSRQLKEAAAILNALGDGPIKAPKLGQPCISKERGIGECMSLKQCYPYFKLFELPVQDTWVMGLYDTCSYTSPKGRSVFGVCCNNTIIGNLPKEQVENQGVTDIEKEDRNVTVEHDAIIEEFPIEAALAAPGAPQCGARTVNPTPTLYDTPVSKSVLRPTKDGVITESETGALVSASIVTALDVLKPSYTSEVESLPSYNLYGIYPGMPGPVGTSFRPVDSAWARNFLYNPGFRIVNGVEAIPHEFPFMAVLLNRNRQFCGGSLIDKKHILTAAHCVAHMSKYDVQNLRVRLGDHNIHKNNEATHIEKRVKRVIRHKGFSSSTLWNDVAILTLEENVDFNSNIQPICLAEGSSTYVDNIVTVAGWGTLKEGGKQPSVLMKVDVKVWTNDRCKSSYGSQAPGGITSHMLCASDKNRDSCSGDSGGPLFDCPWGGRCTQIGIVSWGIGCAKPQYPGVYTRVTQMLDWIQRIVDEY